MIGWLESNPVGKVLASISAGLLVVLALLALAWSLPPSASSGDGEDDEGALSVQVPGLAATAPIETFSVITERPVFNESRQPEFFEETDEEKLAENEAAAANADVEPPEVTLSGVVITPTQRIVILQPKGAEESLIALEGNPLEGDFGSWEVKSIEPRSALLTSGSGEEVRVDLQIHDAMIAEPPKPPPTARSDDGDAAAADGDDRPLSRAEEIRQRIAERREELRRAAEENEQAQPRRPAYNAAIQQLIQGKRTETEDEKPD
ncbi:MAG: hypothetical protein P8Y54_12610 [Xanthomonadales bacterium]